MPLRRHAKRRVRCDDDRRRARIADNPSQTRRRRRPTRASMELKILLWIHIVGKLQPSRDAPSSRGIIPASLTYTHTHASFLGTRATRRISLIASGNVAVLSLSSMTDGQATLRGYLRTLSCHKNRVSPRSRWLLYTFIAPIGGISGIDPSL